MPTTDPTHPVIVTFDDRFAAAFKQLNLAWLDGYHLLEPADLKYLDHPREMILDRGGQIFLAVVDDEAVGACAAVRLSGAEWELAKLAVATRAQGRGLGRKLTEAALAYARDHGATKVSLVSNHQLVAAIRLYESLGFRHAPLPADPGYATADVYMELLFTPYD